MASSWRKTALLTISALGITSLVIVSLHLDDGRAIFSQQPSTVLVQSDPQQQMLEATDTGIVTKVNIRYSSFYRQADQIEMEEQDILNSKQTDYIELEKQVHRNRPPQNVFQWMYNDTTTLVYSAHYDNRDSVIKILGFKHRFELSPSDSELVLCRYPDNSIVPMTTLYNVSVIQPRPGLLYNTWIWTCSWRSGAPPVFLSLVTQAQYVLLAYVNVTYHSFPSGAEKLKQPVLCVKPMVNNYSDVYQLREFIESSRLWGVGKIVLYTHSIHKPTIQPVIDHYKHLGFVETHQWSPPVNANTLHAYGQKSHNQHCLYTYMYRYQWAGFIDLDELIIANESIGNMEFMLQAGVRSVLHPLLQSHIAGFTIRSQMCIISLPDDPIYGSPKGKDMCRITSFRKTNCTLPMKPGVWSKPIVNTDGTEIVDIHAIRLPRPGYVSIDLDPTIATVHHYRALKHSSIVLAQSARYNVQKRNTHIYKDRVRQIFGAMCDYNNPLIGDTKFTD